MRWLTKPKNTCDDTLVAELQPGETLTNYLPGLDMNFDVTCVAAPEKRQQVKVQLPPARQQVVVVIPEPKPGPILTPTRICDLIVGQYGFQSPRHVIVRDAKNNLFVQTSQMAYGPEYLPASLHYKITRASDGYELEGPMFIPELGSIYNTSRPIVYWKVV